MTVVLLTPIVPTLNPGPNVVPGTPPLDPEELIFTAAAANQWAPIAQDMMTIIFVKNTDNNVSHTLTMLHHRTGESDNVVSVTGATLGVIKIAGVFLPYRWANTAAATTAAGKGSCQLTWSSTTGMSIAVVHVPYASI